MPTSHRASGLGRFPGRLWLLAGVLVTAAGCGAAGLSQGAAGGDTGRVGEAFRYPLKPGNHVLTVSALGALVASKDYDVIVAGGLGRSTIEYIAEEGSAVTSGTLILKLATERIERQVRNAQVELTRAQAELKKQEQQQKVTLAEAEDALRQKQVQLENARKQLELLEKGSDAEELERAQLKIRSFEKEVSERVRRLAVQDELRAKGFASQLQYEEAKDALERSRLQLGKERNLLAKLQEGAREAERERLRLSMRKFASEATLARRALDEKSAVAKLELQKTALDVDHRKAALAERERTISQCKITAPIPGTVVHQENIFMGGQRFAVGSTVWGGMRVIKLVQLGTLQANVAVSEQQIDRVKPKAPVELSVRAAPERKWPARVTRISGVAHLREADDPRGPKDFDVVLDLEEKADELLPNLQVSASIETQRLNGVFKVPRDAALPSTGSEASGLPSTSEVVVLVGSGERAAERRTVKLAASDEDFFYVRDGLAAGEWLSLLTGDTGAWTAARKPASKGDARSGPGGTP